MKKVATLQQRNSATAQQTTNINIKLRKRFIMFLTLVSIMLLGLQGKAQFQNPSIFATAYPSPALPSDYLGTQTAYLSNYSNDVITAWGSTLKRGIALVAWTYSTSAGGGGKIALGSYDLTAPSAPFTGHGLINIPNAIDIRVGAMGADLVVAAYYDISTYEYKFSWWHWAGPGYAATLVGTYVLPLATSATSYERISMDINLDADNAAIVYSNNDTVWGVGAYLTGAIVNFSPAISLSIYGGFGTGNTNADVAFNRNASSYPIKDKVYYTYYNAVSGVQAVYHIDWDIFRGLISGIPSPEDTYTLPTGVQYVNFDCPDMYSFGHWAYTYTYNQRITVRCDTGTVYVFDVNDVFCTPLPNIVNTGSIVSAPDIAYKLNEDRDEIIVAWASTEPSFYSLTPAYTNTYIAASIAVSSGTWGGSVPKSVSGPDYAIIPDSFNTYTTASPLIALERRVINSNRFVSYATNNLGFALEHKNIDFTNPFYRKSNPTNDKVVLEKSPVSLKIYPNPFTESLHIQIPAELQNDNWKVSLNDVLGRQLLSYEGKNIKQALEEKTSKLSTGQYFIKLMDIHGKVYNFKVSKI